ncbi:Uncharacterised protein [Mycobacteroides abscessus subsp. abscessus]|nr:Uncharacterised protein [Mycobacteroides abscessus subsp. abscessus]
MNTNRASPRRLDIAADTASAYSCTNDGWSKY